ncbi:hypothetical protein BU17DRAFT_40681 [Hysterangium stoloniferum]|nr:hypothetical protein BU17DRAFT_40681 [Hysterangium stoloniferum]
MRVPSFYAFSHQSSDSQNFKILPLVLETVSGAIHFLHWLYIFPTHRELLLWRVCSVLVADIPSLFYTYFAFVRVSPPNRGPRCFAALLIFTLPVLVLARLGLLLEAIILFRALPSKAHANVEWTSFIPHI